MGGLGGRMTGARAIGVVAVLVGVAASASGCESASDPPATASSSVSAGPASPSASTSASATPSPSETSSIPAAAREKTPEGAEAFVKYFMERVNVAWTAPATGLIAADSTDDCKFCATTEETAKWLVEHEQRYSKEPVTVTRVDALTGAPEGQIYLAATVVQNASDIVTQSGSVTSTEQRKVLERNVALKWADGRWYMFAVEKS